ncbi:MAG: hypothetical protein IPL84_11620 [Chitinophagaceae bacterium]|nr:hypothetical protein [Chitinophagaceae bacterium]
MKIQLILISMLALSAATSAQIERKPVEISKADTEISPARDVPADKKSRKDLMKDLDLTREQRGKLKELRDKNSTAKAALENNPALSEMEKKKKLRELKKDQAEQMLAILTPEQQEKFKANRQNNP